MSSIRHHREFGEKRAENNSLSITVRRRCSKSLFVVRYPVEFLQSAHLTTVCSLNTC